MPYVCTYVYIYIYTWPYVPFKGSLERELRGFLGGLADLGAPAPSPQENFGLPKAFIGHSAAARAQQSDGRFQAWAFSRGRLLYIYIYVNIYMYIYIYMS